MDPKSESTPRKAAAAAVAAGILLSRLAGLVRERAFAYYLGNSDAAGAFRAALRIPNLLQNLFGEGVLSASFIPVYVKLRAEGDDAGAARVAGTVLSLLTTLVVLLVGLGVALTRPLIELLAPGFAGEVRELTGDLVAIMFPGVGLLVLSAWALGVLNSHRRFFLSYVAPVLWNAAIIAALIVAGFGLVGEHRSGAEIARYAAWGTVAGAALQLLVQLPLTLRLLGGLPLSWRVNSGPVRLILRNFLPAVLTRGVVQLSAYIDQVLASYLGPAAVAALAYTQTVSTLPIAMFGTAVSAAELPEMASARGTSEQVAAALRERLEAGLRRIAFFIVPSAVAFVALGDVVAATLFQTGRFTQADSQFVWLLLVGSAVGLLATTQSRLCVSVFWALHDTRTPTRFAVIRVALTAALGYAAVFPLRQWLGLSAAVAASVLVAAAGMAGWIEFLLIKRALVARIGPFHLGGRGVARSWVVAGACGALAFGLEQLVVKALPPLAVGAIVLGTYGALYLGASLALDAPEAQEIVSRVTRLRRRR